MFSNHIVTDQPQGYSNDYWFIPSRYNINFSD